MWLKTKGFRRPILAVGILVILAAGVWSLSSPQSSSQSGTSVKLLRPAEFALKMNDKGAFVVDVHTPEQTHIPGTDAFIPYDNLAENIDRLPVDKNTPILVYCRSGSMSAQAAEELVAMGYGDVSDLAGGTDAYKEQQVEVAFWPKEQDLGTVIYGDIATTEFMITNYMPLPLEITRLSTSCGCTKAEIEATKLGAYESMPVRVSFDPAVHQDDSDVGEITRTIYLETDNPAYNNLTAEIKALVIKKDR